MNNEECNPRMVCKIDMLLFVEAINRESSGVPGCIPNEEGEEDDEEEIPMLIFIRYRW